MPKKITLYSKFCLKCMWPDKLDEFKRYIAKKGGEYDYKRTAYNHKWHKEASEIYGSDKYQVFFTEGDKIVDLLTWEEKTKKKPLKKGKKKNAKKEDSISENQ